MKPEEMAANLIDEAQKESIRLAKQGRNDEAQDVCDRIEINCEAEQVLLGTRGIEDCSQDVQAAVHGIVAACKLLN